MIPASTEPPLRQGSVRTLGVVASCPVCRDRPLEGRQTVCSPACRAKRWRQSQATRARDDGLRVAVETVIRLLQEALTR
jgi:hypothetical protein